MQFNTTSDYAIRTTLYLAMHQDRRATAAGIEQQMGVPASYLHKVTVHMQKAGIMQTVQGNGGGYRLCRTPTSITLSDILSLTEQSMEINSCLVDESLCSRHATASCPVQKVYQTIRDILKRAVTETTVQTLLVD